MKSLCSSVEIGDLLKHKKHKSQSCTWETVHCKKRKLERPLLKLGVDHSMDEGCNWRSSMFETKSWSIVLGLKIRQGWWLCGE